MEKKLEMKWTLGLMLENFMKVYGPKPLPISFQVYVRYPIS